MDVDTSGTGCSVSVSRAPAAAQDHRHHRRFGFKSRRLGARDLREPRIQRLSGQAISGEPQAERAVGPATPFGDTRAGRPRPHHHPVAGNPRDARRGGRAWPQMRADLCGAIRRGRRRRGPAPRRRGTGAVRDARAARVRAELHGLGVAAREPSALSLDARAYAAAGQCRRGVPVGRHVPVLAAAGLAARARFSPTRYRAATRTASISPTTSTSWSRTPRPASSPAWSRASAGPKPSWRRPGRRWS